MEIDVTRYVEGVDCSLFASSVWESGLQNIGAITWQNALRHVDCEGFLAPEEVAEVRDWLLDLGAWDSDEVAAMSDLEVNALLLQFVAGDVREMEAFGETPEEYEQALIDGTVSGRLYRSDDGSWFFYVGV